MAAAGHSLEKEAVVQREESAKQPKTQLDRLLSPLCRGRKWATVSVCYLCMHSTIGRCTDMHWNCPTSSPAYAYAIQNIQYSII